MRPSRLSSSAIAFAVAAAITSTAARAPAADEDEEDRSWMTRRSRVRDGLAPSLSLGLGFAGASGYPNDAKLIGREEYYSSSNLLVGSTITPALMGALTDWLNFGLMLNLGNYSSNHWESAGGGVGIRVDAFPFWSKERSAARNFGVYAQGGIGWAHLHNTTGNYPDAEAVQSYAGFGLFQEITVVRGAASHLALGPYAQYDVLVASDFERHALTVGLRTVWYGGR